MNRERIQALLDEIRSIAEAEAERPVKYDDPPNSGYKRAIALAKLDAAADILRAILKNL